MLTYPEFDLLLVRHGQSTTNANPDLMGQLGTVPLTDLGEKQADKLRRGLEKIPRYFDFVYASPYKRALDTANIALPGKEKIIVPELIEYNAGGWTGASRSQSLTDDVRLSMNYFGACFRPPGDEGESLNMVQRRVTEWMDKEILYNPNLLALSNQRKQEHKPRPYLIFFTHGMVIKCILQYVMGFERSFMWKVQIDNTSTTSLSFGREGWRVNNVNDCSHLK